MQNSTPPQTYLISICILTRRQLVSAHIDIEEVLYFSTNTAVQGTFRAQSVLRHEKKSF